MLRQTLIFAVLLSLLAFIMIASLPKPEVILSVSARTQAFEYRVFNKESSSILFSNGKLNILPNNVFDDDIKTKCVSGEVFLNANTHVKFRRGTLKSSEAISISFAKNTSSVAGEIIVSNGEAIQMKKNDTLVLDPSDDKCSGTLPHRISIWGDGAIGNLRTMGSSSSRQNGDLLGGQVLISARAVEKIFKVINGAEGLYEAGIINLPLGTRLESESFYSQSDNGEAGQWVGLARPITVDGIHSFQVDFSTEDQRLWLHRSGVRDLGKPDPIGASAFVSQTKDPGIIRLQVFIAAIFLIFQTIASLVQTIELQPLKRPNLKWLERKPKIASLENDKSIK